MCVGNGRNDLSMFKKAINDGMVVAVMEDAEKELISEVQEYARKKEKGKVIIIPIEKNRANRKIYRMSKIFQSQFRARIFDGKKRSNKLQNIERIKVESVKNNDIKKNNVIPRRNGYIEK